MSVSIVDQQEIVGGAEADEEGNTLETTGISDGRNRLQVIASAPGGVAFKCGEEDDDSWSPRTSRARLTKLNERNLKQPPHLRTAYAIETMTHYSPKTLNEDEIRNDENFRPPPTPPKPVKKKTMGKRVSAIFKKGGQRDFSKSTSWMQ